jgi:hypothetical protein
LKSHWLGAEVLFYYRNVPLGAGAFEFKYCDIIIIIILETWPFGPDSIQMGENTEDKLDLNTVQTKNTKMMWNVPVYWDKILCK